MKKLLLNFCFPAVKKTGVLLFAILLTSHLSFSQGIWTWMSGDTVPNSAGVFGTQGVPSVNNHPQGAYGAFCWTDLQGNFWLLGGRDENSNLFCDLWKFNPATLEWTWVNGNGAMNQPAVYGTMGVAAPTNTPGSRSYSAFAWADTSGNLWLYGGNAQSGVCADLWKYNIATSEWTWMLGPALSGQTPVYGTLGIASATNNPGSREEVAVPWTDANGKFWFYGGFGNITYGDMWMYDPVANMWTWESGSQSSGVVPVYGSKGVFAATNTPGCRWTYGVITENSGNFLLFGGYNNVLYADLWEYNPAINQWAWLSGTQNTNAVAVAGVGCQKDSTFYPDGRYENRDTWKDCAGNLWMFGGTKGFPGFTGDMWVYLTATKQWMRVSDSTYVMSSPVYGVLDVQALSNKVGSRAGAAHWKDNSGNFWVWGGVGNKFDLFGNIWRYVPDSNCVKTSCSCSAYAGTITSSRDTICKGSGLTGTLSVSNSSGNLQWLSSADGVHYSGISGATSSAYTTPGSLAQTTYYRVAAGSAGCTDTTKAKMINVIPSPVAGVVTSSRDTICENSGVKSTLTATGGSGNLQWQSSTDGIHFSNLPFDTSSSYTTPPALSQTTYYRVVVNNGCGSDSSNIKPVHIVPGPLANFTYAINGNQVTFNSDSSSKDVTQYSWNFGDNSSLNSQANPTHTFSNPDTFYVCLTVYNNSNCSYTLCKDVDVVTGINNVSAESAIQLYPNPANNTLNILVDGIEGNYQIKIYNVLGQQVWAAARGIHESPLQGKQIITLPLDNLAEGAYELILSNKNQYYAKRFVHL